MNWKHQEFCGLNPVAHNGLTPVASPTTLRTMCQICRKLAKGNPFVRIDLYEVNGKVYFGEITFYPMSGMGMFTPNRWNSILGGMIHLPEKIALVSRRDNLCYNEHKLIKMSTCNYSITIRTLGTAGSKYAQLLNSIAKQSIHPRGDSGFAQ